MKKIYKASILLMMSASIFWVVYTLFFLFKDGWHFTPISKLEKSFDDVIIVAFKIGGFLWFLSVFSLIDKLMKGYDK